MNIVSLATGVRACGRSFALPSIARTTSTAVHRGITKKPIVDWLAATTRLGPTVTIAASEIVC